MPAAARLGDLIGHPPPIPPVTAATALGGALAAEGLAASATSGMASAAVAGASALSGNAIGAGSANGRGSDGASVSAVPTGKIIGPCSGNVFTNGIPAARAHLDLTACSLHPPVPLPIASGSSNVFINGLPAARTGDRVVCGAVIINGSGNVFIGGSKLGSGTVQTDPTVPDGLISEEVRQALMMAEAGAANLVTCPVNAMAAPARQSPLGNALGSSLVRPGLLIAEQLAVRSKGVEYSRLEAQQSLLQSVAGIAEGWWGGKIGLGDGLAMAWSNTKSEYGKSPRAQGYVQYVNGVLEVGAGVALDTTGIGAAVGIVLKAHGADNIGTGLYQVGSGEFARTVTYTGVERLTGSSKAAELVDRAIPIAGGVGSAGAVMRVGERKLFGSVDRSGAKLSFDISLNAVDRAWGVKAGEILAAHPVGRASYARLQKQGTDVKFVNDPKMLEMGLFDRYANEVTVNMLRHSSAEEAASTVVHEALHQHRFFKSGVSPGTQFEEYLAFKNEFLFGNSSRPSLAERRLIINDVVKPLYPQLPSGKLPLSGAK